MKNKGLRQKDATPFYLVLLHCYHFATIFLKTRVTARSLLDDSAKFLIQPPQTSFRTSSLVRQVILNVHRYTSLMSLEQSLRTVLNTTAKGAISMPEETQKSERLRKYLFAAITLAPLVFAGFAVSMVYAQLQAESR